MDAAVWRYLAFILNSHPLYSHPAVQRVCAPYRAKRDFVGMQQAMQQEATRLTSAMSGQQRSELEQIRQSVYRESLDLSPLAQQARREVYAQSVRDGRNTAEAMAPAVLLTFLTQADIDKKQNPVLLARALFKRAQSYLQLADLPQIDEALRLVGAPADARSAGLGWRLLSTVIVFLVCIARVESVSTSTELETFEFQDEYTFGFLFDTMYNWLFESEARPETGDFDPLTIESFSPVATYLPDVTRLFTDENVFEVNIRQDSVSRFDSKYIGNFAVYSVISAAVVFGTSALAMYTAPYLAATIQSNIAVTALFLRLDPGSPVLSTMLGFTLTDQVLYDVLFSQGGVGAQLAVGGFYGDAIADALGRVSLGSVYADKNDLLYYVLDQSSVDATVSAFQSASRMQQGDVTLEHYDIRLKPEWTQFSLAYENNRQRLSVSEVNELFDDLDIALQTAVNRFGPSPVAFATHSEAVLPNLENLAVILSDTVLFSHQQQFTEQLGISAESLKTRADVLYSQLQASSVAIKRNQNVATELCTAIVEGNVVVNGLYDVYTDIISVYVDSNRATLLEQQMIDDQERKVSFTNERILKMYKLLQDFLDSLEPHLNNRSPVISVEDNWQDVAFTVIAAYKEATEAQLGFDNDDPNALNQAFLDGAFCALKFQIETRRQQNFNLLQYKVFFDVLETCETIANNINSSLEDVEGAAKLLFETFTKTLNWDVYYGELSNNLNLNLIDMKESFQKALVDVVENAVNVDVLTTNERLKEEVFELKQQAQNALTLDELDQIDFDKVREQVEALKLNVQDLQDAIVGLRGKKQSWEIPLLRSLFQSVVQDLNTKDFQGIHLSVTAFKERLLTLETVLDSIVVYKNKSDRARVYQQLFGQSGSPSFDYQLYAQPFEEGNTKAVLHAFLLWTFTDYGKLIGDVSDSLRDTEQLVALERLEGFSDPSSSAAMLHTLTGDYVNFVASTSQGERAVWDNIDVDWFLSPGALLKTILVNGRFASTENMQLEGYFRQFKTILETTNSDTFAEYIKTDAWELVRPDVTRFFVNTGFWEETEFFLLFDTITRHDSMTFAQKVSTLRLAAVQTQVLRNNSKMQQIERYMDGIFVNAGITTYDSKNMAKVFVKAYIYGWMENKDLEFFNFGSTGSGVTRDGNTFRNVVLNSRVAINAINAKWFGQRWGRSNRTLSQEASETLSKVRRWLLAIAAALPLVATFADTTAYVSRYSRVVGFRRSQRTHVQWLQGLPILAQSYSVSAQGVQALAQLPASTRESATALALMTALSAVSYSTWETSNRLTPVLLSALQYLVFYFRSSRFFLGSNFQGSRAIHKRIVSLTEIPTDLAPAQREVIQAIVAVTQQWRLYINASLVALGPRQGLSSDTYIWRAMQLIRQDQDLVRMKKAQDTLRAFVPGFMEKLEIAPWLYWRPTPLQLQAALASRYAPKEQPWATADLFLCTLVATFAGIADPVLDSLYSFDRSFLARNVIDVDDKKTGSFAATDVETAWDEFQKQSTVFLPNIPDNLATAYPARLWSDQLSLVSASAWPTQKLDGKTAEKDVEKKFSALVREISVWLKTDNSVSDAGGVSSKEFFQLFDRAKIQPYVQRHAHFDPLIRAVTLYAERLHALNSTLDFTFPLQLFFGSAPYNTAPAYYVQMLDKLEFEVVSLYNRARVIISLNNQVATEPLYTEVRRLVTVAMRSARGQLALRKLLLQPVLRQESANSGDRRQTRLEEIWLPYEQSVKPSATLQERGEFLVGAQLASDREFIDLRETNPDACDALAEFAQSLTTMTTIKSAPVRLEVSPFDAGQASTFVLALTRAVYESLRVEVDGPVDAGTPLAEMNNFIAKRIQKLTPCLLTTDRLVQQQPTSGASTLVVNAYNVDLSYAVFYEQHILIDASASAALQNTYAYSRLMNMPADERAMFIGRCVGTT